MAIREPRAVQSGPKPDKRRAILDASLELFVERGFHGTAVPAIARRAGVGAGTIYRYFASKDALVNELYRDSRRQLSQHLLHRVGSSTSTRETFFRCWNELARFIDAHPLVYEFLELQNHRAYLDAESRALEAQLFALALSFVRQAQARGDLRAGNPQLLWSLVEGAFRGVLRSAQAGRLRLSGARMDAAAMACWDLVRVHPRSRQVAD